MIFNVMDFGAVGDGATDDLAAFNAALDAMVSNVKGGGVLMIPEGNYFLSSTLVIKHRVELLGFSGREANNAINHNFAYDAINGVRKVNGNGIPDPLAPSPTGISRLMFPRGVTGILVSLGGVNGIDHAEGTIIRNLSIVSAIPLQDPIGIFTPADPEKDPTLFDTPPKFGHGISIKCKVHVDNCFIDGFTGNGIHIVTPSQPPPTDDGQRMYDIKHPYLGNLYADNAYEDPVTHEITNYNANAIDSKFCNIACVRNGLNGVYVIGSNSGNMLFEHIYCTGNKRYGFFDSERATGNTYQNCYSNENGAGEYYSLGTALQKDALGNFAYAAKAGSGSVYLNCYQEAPGSTVYFPAMIIEGQLSLDGYHNTDTDAEFLANYQVITDVPMPDSPFGGARPSVIRQGGGGGSSAYTHIPYGVHTKNESAYTTAIDIGGNQATNGKNGVLMTFYHPDPLGSFHSLRYDKDTQYGWWSMEDLSPQPVLLFSTKEANWGNSEGDSALYPVIGAANQSHIWLKAGMFLGERKQGGPDFKRPIYIGSSYDNPATTLLMPPSTDWQAGDIIHNMNPQPGGYAGWIACNALDGEGNPTIRWNCFGKIEECPIL